MKHAWILMMMLALIASAWSQKTVLGNGKGRVRSTNALAAIGGSGTNLEWSRQDFNDGTTGETFGFWPAYTLSNEVSDPTGFGEFLGPNVPIIMPVTTTPGRFPGWPSQITLPRYLYRQGGAATNRVDRTNFPRDHSPLGTAWIKYELDNSNPEGWTLSKVKVWAWDIRDVIQRGFSDTGAPFRVDVYVASNDSDPNSSPVDNAEWTLVGTLSKANGTIPNVCEWDPNTRNTFGECPQSFRDFLGGNNPQGVVFYNDPTNDLWYSIVEVNASHIRYVALVIPEGNQYGRDPTLTTSENYGSSLRFTNITDVRVVAVADVNGDGCVNDRDAGAVLTAFGQTGELPEDVNGDGIVNEVDVRLVLSDFARGCS